MSLHNIRALLALTALVIGASACSKGGQLVLEPGARLRSKGTPTVEINDGAKALVVEQGKTATSGVHGWVSVHPVASRDISSGTNQPIIVINKSAALAQ